MHFFEKIDFDYMPRALLRGENMEQNYNLFYDGGGGGGGGGEDFVR